jgi:hypothetical protein
MGWKRIWLGVRYVAVNTPLAVLVYWLSWKATLPTWLCYWWAATVMLADPGTRLMAPGRGEAP